MSLTNAQFKAILKEYADIQDANRSEAERRKEEVLKAIPELTELDDSVSSLSVSAARSMLSGKTDAINALHARLAEISAKRKALLVSAGFSANYLEPIYDCPKCKDTGYINTTEGSQKCSCFKARELTLLYSQSNIREMLEGENFSTLSYQYYQGEDLLRFQSAVNICKDFTNNFNRDYANLLFYGTVGTGKSFLSGCVAKELMDRGHSVIYFSAATLFEQLARYTFGKKEKDSLQDFYDDLYSCELLIIDDLGTELTNDFVASQLFSCLNERGLRKKATIISTNLSLEEIRDRYSDRIFSRLSNSFKLLKITGRDIRIQKKIAQNK